VPSFFKKSWAGNYQLPARLDQLPIRQRRIKMLFSTRFLALVKNSSTWFGSLVYNLYYVDTYRQQASQAPIPSEIIHQINQLAQAWLTGAQWHHAAVLLNTLVVSAIMQYLNYALVHWVKTLVLVVTVTHTFMVLLKGYRTVKAVAANVLQSTLHFYKAKVALLRAVVKGLLN
jgi:hypothetical protein